MHKRFPSRVSAIAVAGLAIATSAAVVAAANTAGAAPAAVVNTTVTETLTIPSGTIAEPTLTCPAGTQVVSPFYGKFASKVSGVAQPLDVYASLPTSDMKGWRFSLKFPQSSNATGQIGVICSPA